MSHYKVFVFTESDKRHNYMLEKNLARYSEHLVMDPYVKYTKEEAITEAKNRTADNIAYYKTVLEEREKRKEEALGNVDQDEMTRIEENIMRVKGYLTTLKEKENWTDEQYYEEIVSMEDEEMISENGDILSTYNPDSKWDWYVVGGRWSGELRKKDGTPVDEGYVKDLDFSSDKEEYDEHIKWWKENVEGDGKDLFYRKEYYIDRYKNAETFATICSSPHARAAVTPDGEWHEPGAMGWFGVSSESNEDGLKWDLEFHKKFIEPAIKNNWYVTVVDCHI